MMENYGTTVMTITVDISSSKSESDPEPASAEKTTECKIGNVTNNYYYTFIILTEKNKMLLYIYY